MPINAHQVMEINLLLSPNGLLTAVSGMIARRDSVTRQSLWRWRKQLRITEAPYTLTDAEAIAHYADLLSIGTKPDRAKEMTIEYLKRKKCH